MSKESQTKYELQLPKLEGWRFDRVFGYTAGLSSIGGLVAAPFVVQDQNILSYLYMGFLSLLVIVLLLHAVLIEKRKLHRYAQTVFHTHFCQHLVRDALSELTNSKKYEIESVTQKILDSIASAFSITSGKTCRVSIVQLENTVELRWWLEIQCLKLEPNRARISTI